MCNQLFFSLASNLNGNQACNNSYVETMVEWQRFETTTTVKAEAGTQ